LEQGYLKNEHKLREESKDVAVLFVYLSSVQQLKKDKIAIQLNIEELLRQKEAAYNEQVLKLQKQ
jgi:hypothetical protein